MIDWKQVQHALGSLPYSADPGMTRSATVDSPEKLIAYLDQYAAIVADLVDKHQTAARQLAVLETERMTVSRFLRGDMPPGYFSAERL